MSFDDNDWTWNHAIFLMRVLSLAQANCSLKFSLRDGRVRRSTIRMLEDLAQPFIRKYQEAAQRVRPELKETVQN